MADTWIYWSHLTYIVGQNDEIGWPLNLLLPFVISQALDHSYPAHTNTSLNLFLISKHQYLRTYMWCWLVQWWSKMPLYLLSHKVNQMSLWLYVYMLFYLHFFSFNVLSRKKNYNSNFRLHFNLYKFTIKKVEMFNCENNMFSKTQKNMFGTIQTFNSQ